MKVESQSWVPSIGSAIVVLTYVTSLFLVSLSIPTLNPRLLDRLSSGIEGGSAKIEAESIKGPKTIDLRGYECFRESFRVGSNGLPILVWCANPAIWIGVFCLATRKFTSASVAGVMALALGLLAAFVLPYVGRGNADIYWSWFDYRIGYWIWLASAVALVAFGIAGRRSPVLQNLVGEVAEQPHAPEPAAGSDSSGQLSPPAR